MSTQEEESAVADFINRYDLSYQFVLDQTGAVSNGYEVTTTPTTFFVGPDGIVTDVLVGVMNRGWLEDNINDSLNK